METRKLIQSGPSSMILSLPVKWLKQNKLSKGDIVYLDIVKNEIKISSLKKEKKRISKPILIDSKKNHLTKEYIKNAMINNYNPIKVKIYDNLNYLSKILENFQGISYDVDDNHLIIKDHFDFSSIDFKKELQNLLSLNHKLFNDIVNNNNNNNSNGKTSSEIVLLISFLKKKAFLLEKTLNYFIEHPYDFHDFNFKKFMKYKIILQELPFMLDSELEITKQLGYLQNQIILELDLEKISELLTFKKIDFKKLSKTKALVEDIKFSHSGVTNYSLIKFNLILVSIINNVIKIQHQYI